MEEDIGMCELHEPKSIAKYTTHDIVYEVLDYLEYAHESLEPAETDLLQGSRDQLFYKFQDLITKRIEVGNKKYKGDWVKKDNIKEGLDEAGDLPVYIVFTILQELEKQMNGEDDALTTTIIETCKELLPDILIVARRLQTLQMLIGYTRK